MAARDYKINDEGAVVDNREPPTPAEVELEQIIDLALDKRSRLTEIVQRLERYDGSVPTEVLAQQTGLTNLHPQLEEATQAISILRGDFLPGDPAIRIEKDELPDDRARRYHARKLVLQDAGVRGYRIQMANEEGCSVSNVQKYLNRYKKLEDKESPNLRRRRLP